MYGAAVVCRLGDRREVTLGDLGNAETVRAEEVNVVVPGGQGVRAGLITSGVRVAVGALLLDQQDADRSSG